MRAMPPIRWILGATLALACACEPPSTFYPERRELPVRTAPTLRPPADPAPARLKVMTWNVKYGGARIDFWFDLWGDRVHMTRAEVEANMAGLYALINEVQPDILLTNEIEVNSARSAYYDMVAGILEHTQLDYAGYVPTWQSRWIPTEGLGRMDMGNAIFSRYPIEKLESIPQANRTDQDPLTDYFYLHRSVGRAVVDVGGKELAVMVVHTEAYDTDGTKSRQFVEIQQLLANEPLTWLVGGDFNAIPPNAEKTSNFNDDNPRAIGTSFETPPYALGDMQPFYDAYLPAIELSRMGTTEPEQRRYYTHSIIGPDRQGSLGEPGFWTRKLDYLFVNAPSFWVPGTTDVLQQTGDSGIASNPLVLSDHCPVVGVWELVR